MLSVTSVKFFVVTLWSFKNGIVSGNPSCLGHPMKVAELRGAFAPGWDVAEGGQRGDGRWTSPPQTAAAILHIPSLLPCARCGGGRHVAVTR